MRYFYAQVGTCRYKPRIWGAGVACAGIWVSHCVRISWRDMMQHTRSPPAPEPPTEVSAVGFADRDSRGDTELFHAVEMQMVLTWPSHISTKPRPLLAHTLSSKYHSSYKEETSIGFFFSPWENCFQGQKVSAYHLWGKEIQHLELAFVSSWKSLWNLSAWECLSLEPNNDVRPCFIDILELCYRAVWKGEPPLTFLTAYVLRCKRGIFAIWKGSQEKLKGDKNNP